MVHNVFNDTQSQEVVDAILTGYKNYIDVRLKAKKELRVSAGYAWTKPNFIDDAFSKAELQFITKDTIKHAGQSWEYIEFESYNGELGKVLLIIKGEARLKQTFPEVAKKQTGYLFELAKINNSFIEKQISIDENEDEAMLDSVQLELISDSELEALAKNASEVNNFLILTHQVDSNYQMTKIQVVMPDAHRGKLLPLQDLSSYISLSSVDFSDEKYQELADLSDITDVEDFGILPRVAVKEQG